MLWQLLLQWWPRWPSTSYWNSLDKDVESSILTTLRNRLLIWGIISDRFLFFTAENKRSRDTQGVLNWTLRIERWILKIPVLIFNTQRSILNVQRTKPLRISASLILCGKTPNFISNQHLLVWSVLFLIIQRWVPIAHQVLPYSILSVIISILPEQKLVVAKVIVVHARFLLANWTARANFNTIQLLPASQQWETSITNML